MAWTGRPSLLTKRVWINQRDPNYDSYPPIGDKKDKTGRTIFANFGRGLEIVRDAWVYNSSAPEVRSNIARMIDNYNDEVVR